MEPDYKQTLSMRVIRRLHTVRFKEEYSAKRIQKALENVPEDAVLLEVFAPEGELNLYESPPPRCVELVFQQEVEEGDE
jgi:hypothetical protein